MGQSVEIDRLVIEVDTNAKKASNGLSSLAKQLERLKATVESTSTLVTGLTSLSAALEKMSKIGKINLSRSISQIEKFASLSTPEVTAASKNISEIAVSLQSFTNVPKVNLSSISTGIKNLSIVAQSVDSEQFARFSATTKSIAAALSNLSSVKLSGFSGVISALKKLPEITKSLDDESVSKFATAIKKLVEALKPLAEQMDVVSKGFASLPTQIQRAIKASTKVSAENNKTSKSYNSLSTRLSRAAAKFYILYQSLQRVVDIFAEAFNVSNEYIEALNLFRVSMGKAADSALDYAESISAAMGIDVAEWITNQGMFQRMATGFGVAANDAEIMSKNLTQLAYDMSSFFNIDVETAMDKLQSGMSGQIKGLKALGYNLSVAALQETAYAIGIEESVRNMTEAERAQLRYITLIRTSKGVMGDMAKTITTPANALRILQAQLKQLERAFGDIVSVLVVEIIPYVQAFAKAMTETARSLAAVMGFEIADLPSNNLEAASEIIDELDDGVNDASASLEALKKQLMGFDELNILKSPESAILDDTELSESVIDFELPEYDFLMGLDASYGQRIDEISVSFKNLIGTLENFLPIGVATFALFAFDKVKKVLSTSKAFATLITVFKGLGAAFKEAGIKGIFSSLKGSLKEIISKMSPLLKIVGAIAAVAIEFNVVMDAAYNLAKGMDNVASSLLSIVGISGVVGAAMYAMLGPWGLVLAAVAGVAGAVAGLAKAHDELIEENLNAAFYNGVGVSINEVSSAFDALMSSITAGKEDLGAAAENIAAIQTSVSKTASNISLLGDKMVLGYKTIEETVPLIKSEFDKLYNDTVTVLNNEADLIYNALAGAAGDALADLGYNLAEIGALIGATVNNTTVDLEKLKIANDKILDDIAAGKIDPQKGMLQYMENVAAIAQMAGTDINKAQSAIENYGENLKLMLQTDIDYKDAESVQKFLSDLSASSKQAKDVVTEYYDSFINSLQDMQSKAKTQAEKDYLGDVIEGVMSIKDKDIAKIDKETKSVLEKIFSDMQEFVDEYAVYENASFWTKVEAAMGGFQVGMSAKEYWANYGDPKAIVKDMLEPITSAMEGYFEDLVPEGTFDRLFEDGATLGGGLTAGLADGLLETDEVVAAAKKMADDVIGASADAFKINSPSKVMQEQGANNMQGLANGISENTRLVTSTFDSMIEYMLQRLDTLGAKFATVPNMLFRAQGFSAPRANDGLGKAVFDAVVSANEYTRGNGQPSRIVVQIDGRTVGEVSVEYINGQIVQTGESPIYI